MTARTQWYLLISIKIKCLRKVPSARRCIKQAKKRSAQRQELIFMLPAFTQKCTDQSTEDEFTFTFYCDICAKPWKSVPISFSSKQKSSFWKRFLDISSTSWTAEYKDAFDRANREAMFHFNRCPICKKWVCDDHFSEEENICSNCFKK